MHIGVAGNRRHDGGAAAAGEAADFLDHRAPVGLAERGIALAASGNALARQIALEHGIGGARIDVIGADQKEAVDALAEQEVHRGDCLLRRRRAGIEDVARGLLALVLAGIEQQRIVALDDRQHFLARCRAPAAEYSRDLVVADELFRQFGIGLRIGLRIDDDRLERPAEEPAVFILPLDQHDQELLQRPLARGHGAGQRMQDADLDRAEFEIGEIARHRVDQPLRAAEQIRGGGDDAVAGFLDARSDGRNFRQYAGDRAGDLLGAIADAIDLGGLVIEDAGQLPVGVAHRRHARRHPGYGLDGFVDRMLDVVNLRRRFRRWPWRSVAPAS